MHITALQNFDNKTAIPNIRVLRMHIATCFGLNLTPGLNSNLYFIVCTVKYEEKKNRKKRGPMKGKFKTMMEMRTNYR